MGKRGQVLSSIIAVIFVSSLVSVITLPAGAVSTPNPFILKIFKFNDLNGDGIVEAGEPGLAGAQFTVVDSSAGSSCSGSPGIGCGNVVCSGTTDSNGYLICPPIDPSTTTAPYQIREIQAPTGFTPTTLTQVVNPTSSPVEVDFANHKIILPPPPIPSDITVIGAQTWTYNNLPVVYWLSSTTITRDVTGLCGGTDPTSVNLVIGPFSDTPSLGTVSASMTKEGATKIWTATFPPFFPHHGTAPLAFTVTCLDTTTTTENGQIFVDPSGAISNACTGKPISGATATILVESPPGSGTFVTAAATNPPITPTSNPETTLADGLYAWAVIPGKYEVTAAASGYVSQTSGPLTVPPPVIGLNFSLTPVAGCSTSIPEFPFSFNLVIIFVAVTAVYLAIRQKMIPNFKRF